MGRPFALLLVVVGNNTFNIFVLFNINISLQAKELNNN